MSIIQNSTNTDFTFWAYLHINGEVRAKRYFDYKDIEEAVSSPFIEQFYATYIASDIIEAQSIAEDYFRLYKARKIINEEI